MKLASHLWQSRHGIFYIRYNHNGNEIKRSLRTRDPRTAQKLAYRINAMNTDDVLKKIKSGQTLGLIYKSQGVEIVTDGSESEHQQAQELIKLYHSLNQSSALNTNHQQLTNQFNSSLIRTSLEDAVNEYLAERKETVSERTYGSWKGEFKQLKNGLGHKTAVADITQDAYIHFRKHAIDKLAPSSMDSRNNTYKNFFQWCISRGRAEINPVVALTLSRIQRAKLQEERGRDRDPYEKADLDLLFNDTIMQKIKKPCLFWMPLLSFFSGARAEELVHIKIDSIKEYEINKYQLHISKSKTPAGIRFIPIHPKLIELGFLDYVDEVMQIWGKSSTLFPYMAPVDGRLTHKFSMEFGEHRTALGILKQKDFHSFRSTVIGVLKLNNVNAEFRREFVGHESSEKEDTHLKNYASKTKFPMQHLEKEVLNKLDYASALGFNLSISAYLKGRFTRYLRNAKIRKADAKLKKTKSVT